MRNTVLVLLILGSSTLVLGETRNFVLRDLRVQQPARGSKGAFYARASSGTVQTGKVLQLTASGITLTTVDEHQQATLVVTAATLDGDRSQAILGGPLTFGWRGGHGTATAGNWGDGNLALQQIRLQGKSWTLDAPFGILYDLNQPTLYARLVSGVNAWIAPSLLH